MSWTEPESEIIKGMSKTLTNIDIALNGKEDDASSTGLVGEVHANTRFRKNINKKVNAVGVILSGLVSKVIYSWWIKEGGN